MNTLTVAAIAVFSTVLLLGLLWWGLGSTFRAYVRYMLWKKTSRHSSGDGEHVEVNGVRIYVERHGSGQDVVLLHGAMGFMEWFFNQIPDLVREFRLIGLDTRAQGRSSGGDGPLSYELFASDVAAVLDHLNIRAASFVGWSDGAIIAMQLAMVRPDLVGKMVLIGANFHPDGLFDDMKKFLAERTVETLDTPSRKFYRKLSPHPHLLGEVLGKMTRMLLTEPRYETHDLARISCPTLVLNGENENAILPEHAQALVQAIPGARFLAVPDADHLAPMQKPRFVNEAIKSFLSSEPRHAPAVNQGLGTVG